VDGQRDIQSVSGRDVGFLSDWLEKNVTVPNPDASPAKARELAASCIADATALGITTDDMEPEFGSVETIIYEAMKNYFDAELEFWKAFAAARKQKLGH
jgi:hypothetical protein